MSKFYWILVGVVGGVSAYFMTWKSILDVYDKRERLWHIHVAGFWHLVDAVRRPTALLLAVVFCLSSFTTIAELEFAEPYGPPARNVAAVDPAPPIPRAAVTAPVPPTLSATILDVHASQMNARVALGTGINSLVLDPAPNRLLSYSMTTLPVVNPQLTSLGLAINPSYLNGGARLYNEEILGLSRSASITNGSLLPEAALRPSSLVGSEHSVGLSGLNNGFLTPESAVRPILISNAVSLTTPTNEYLNPTSNPLSVQVASLGTLTRPQTIASGSVFGNSTGLGMVNPSPLGLSQSGPLFARPYVTACSPITSTLPIQIGNPVDNALYRDGSC